jgi:hypothetical protein
LLSEQPSAESVPSRVHINNSNNKDDNNNNSNNNDNTTTTTTTTSSTRTSTTNKDNNNNNNNNNNTIPNNKPDIIIRDNEKGTCMLIDVAISRDRNVMKREAEKILKPKDLTIEIQRRKYVSNITGNHEVRELQKTAILGTAHILREVLT